MAITPQQHSLGFGVILVLLGSFLSIFPLHAHLLLDTITFTGSLPPLSEPLWLTAFGILAIYIGCWYLALGYYDVKALYQFTVVGRLLIMPSLNIFLLLIGAVPLVWVEASLPVDVLSGLHMVYCLRSEKDSLQKKSA